MPEISIITPVYQAEKFLKKCVDSILSQSFTDWELLLVDDGSTDKSSEICRTYAEQDARIRYHQKENGGVSSARNASGRWCWRGAGPSCSRERQRLRQERPHR